jgi:hypothetical protein
MKSVKYINKDELNELKNKLIEKLYRDISKKYHTILVEKEYDVKKFANVFQKEIEKNFDFNNPDYKRFFRTIEEIVLKKLSTIEDKKRDQLIGVEDINRETNYMTFNENVTEKNKLKKKLDKKKEDEWDKIIKYDYQQYLEETKNNIEEERNKKLKISNELDKQIKDKIIREEEIKQNDDKYYNQILKKAIDTLDIEEKEKNLKAKEKFIKEKELLLSSMKGI